MNPWLQEAIQSYNVLPTEAPQINQNIQISTKNGTLKKPSNGKIINLQPTQIQILKKKKTYTIQPHNLFLPQAPLFSKLDDYKNNAKQNYTNARNLTLLKTTNEYHFKWCDTALNSNINNLLTKTQKSCILKHNLNISNLKNSKIITI